MVAIGRMHYRLDFRTADSRQQVAVVYSLTGTRNEKFQHPGRRGAGDSACTGARLRNATEVSQTAEGLLLVSRQWCQSLHSLVLSTWQRTSVRTSSYRMR